MGFSSVSGALVGVAALFSAAAQAMPPQHYYYAGGRAYPVEPSERFVAVATPSAAARRQLAAAVTSALGDSGRRLEVPRAGVTLVRSEKGLAATPLPALLARQGLATRFAAAVRNPDGTEAWPIVFMPEVRVRFRSAAEAAPTLAGGGVTVVWQRNEGRDYLLRTRSSAHAFTLAARLVESGVAEFAYPDMLLRRVRRAIPNDPYYAEQWHLATIGAPAAWDTDPISSVTIAILDSGVDLAHPDLVQNLVPGYDAVGDGISYDLDPSPGLNDSHGTAVAGLAAAAGDNGIGVSGVCPACKIMPIRLLTEESSYVLATSEEAAFKWAREHGARILSNSWGPEPPITTNVFPAGLAEEIHKAVLEQRIVVFAAGNDSSPLKCVDGVPWEPAASAEVISVGATSDQDVLEWYSNYGAPGCPLTLTAPAGNVSTDRVGKEGYGPTDYTHTFSGTSAATPLVSGAIGVLLSIDPSLEWGQILDVLTRSAEKVPAGTFDADGYSPYYGHGRLNLYGAVELLVTGQVCEPDAGGELYGGTACADGRDNDCDGMVDAADLSCAPDDLPVGSPCTRHGECAGALCLADLPSGYCTAMCPTGDCPFGSSCTLCDCDTGPGTQPGCDCDPDGCACDVTSACDAESSTSAYACACDRECNICLDDCRSDLDCRSGYLCGPVSASAYACVPGCQTYGDDPCGTGYACNTATGWCEPTGGTIDESCSQDGDCGTGEVCCAASHTCVAASACEEPACVCDDDPYCDGDCPCDADCPCTCDLTYACDASCACDPECSEKGCGCAGDAGGSGGLGAVVGLGLLLRRRRRHAGGA